MRRHVANIGILGCLLLSLPTITRGKGDDLPPAAALDDVAIGDWYTIDCQCGTTTEQFNGRLIKANDQWLVLHRRIVIRVAVKSPLFSAIPLLGQLLTSSRDRALNELLWIPRDAGTVVDRKPDKTSKPVVKIEEESPPLKEDCQIVVAASGKADWRVCRLTAVDDENFHLASERIARNSVLAIRLGRPVDAVP